MKRSFKVTLGVVAASLVLVGCGGGGSSSGVSTLSAKPIETIQEAKVAAAALASTMQLNNITPKAPRTGNSHTGLTKPRMASTIAQGGYTQTLDCPDGGNYMISYDNVSSSKMSMTMRYDNCRTGVYLSDGAATIDMTFKNAANATNNTISMKMVTDNYVVKSEDNTIKMDLSIASTVNYKYSTSYTMNSVSTTKGSVVVIADGVTSTYHYKNLHTKSSLSSSILTTEMDGAMQIATPCYTGSLTIETIKPLVISTATSYGMIRSGTLKVNGVQYTYHDNGTVTVTMSNGTSETIAQDALSEACEIE